MNLFDSAVIHFLNGFAHKSAFFDTLVYLVAESYVFKGGVVMGIFWWLWFRYADQVLSRETREALISTMAGAMIAVLIGKILGGILPFRSRPMNDAGLHFVIPFGLPANEVTAWQAHNSFPSDHAALFFSFATGMLLISRRLGIILVLYLSVIIGAARIYCGLHYPTDILAGGLIGVSVTLFMNRTRLRELVSKPVLSWLRKSEATFYPVLFLLSYEVVVLFNDVREYGGFFLRAVEGKL